MARRTHNRKDHDSRRFYDWMEKADEDIEAARILLAGGAAPEMAAFHCQQGIEKALKGYLIFKTRQSWDGHNLTYFCRRAMELDVRFQEWLDESVTLNRYYIETRYPTDFPLEITRERVEHLYKMADDMMNFIEDRIDESFDTVEA